jgi:hypothetical protein
MVSTLKYVQATQDPIYTRNLGNRNINANAKKIEENQGRKQYYSTPGYNHRVAFFPHLVFDFGGSDISKDDNFEFPFSRSLLPTLGVFGTSCILDKPLVDFLLGFCTSLGNAERLGVKAMAIFLADFLIFARSSHDLFFAKYQRTDETTSIS